MTMHNFGEPTLHPDLPEMISLARSEKVLCTFFTNGLVSDGRPLPRSYWQKLADHGLESVNFSAHGLSTEAFQNIIEGVVVMGRVFDPRARTLGTWAGQTGPPEVPVEDACIFRRMNAFVVLWDGRISGCCLDVEGAPAQLTVDELLKKRDYAFSKIPLCKACASMRHDELL